MGAMPPEEIVVCAAGCGMTGIDWVTLHGKDPAYLRKISEDAGLAVAAHTPLNTSFVQGLSDGMEEFKRSLEDACILHAPVMMVPPFPLAEQRSMAGDRQKWIGFYAEAQPLARAAGVALCVESTGFRNSPITAGDELLEVLTAVPGMQVVFDNGNTATADDMVSSFEKVRSKVVHFHLKDWEISDTFRPGSGLKRTGKYYRDCVIGEGDLDLNDLLKNHVLPVYNGFFNLETSDPSGKRTPEQVMQQVCSYLRENFA